MAEIKSTLDLIMERTKNLTLTEEEKKALHAQELRGKIRGWVQKCLDGTLDRARLQAEMEREGAGDPELRSGLLQELRERIDPGGENEILFQLLGEVLHRDTAPLREILERFRGELAERVREKTAGIKDELEEERKISGSAVVPNLDGDPRWKEEREQLRNSCLREIRSALSP